MLSKLLCLLPVAAAEETHPSVVHKLIKASTGTFLLKVAKQFDYDEGVDVKDLSDKLVLATQEHPDVHVLHVGIPEKAFQGDGEEENPENEETPEDPEAAEAAEGGEGADEETDPQDKTIDYKVKDKQTIEVSKKMIDELKIDTNKMPYLAVYRGGNEISNLQLTGKKWEDVKTWASGNKIALANPTDAVEASLPSELQEAIDKIASAIISKDDSMLQEALKEVQKSFVAASADDSDEADLGEDNSSTKAKRDALRRKMFQTTLEKVVNKGASGAMQYADKEIKRVTGLLSSPAIAQQKKNEMKHKIKCLTKLAEKVNPPTTDGKEDL